jgi:hypothetical protein
MNELDLFKSAWQNDTDGAQRALAAGADPNAQHPRAGTVPLQVACQGNAIAVIKMLLDAGAKADAVYTRTSRVDGRIFANHTPLMYANSVEAAELLLNAGAKLEATDEKGWTALVRAAHAENLELVRYLLDRGADTAVHPIYCGKQMNLFEFLDAAMEPPPGFEETEGGRQRRLGLSAVRDFLAARVDIQLNRQPGRNE